MRIRQGSRMYFRNLQMICMPYATHRHLPLPTHMSTPTSPHPSSPSLSSHKLTTTLNAARRGESSAPSTPPLRRPLSAHSRKQALREFYNLDKSRATNTSVQLDRPDFDGKTYVDKLVKERDLGTLISLENDLVQGNSSHDPEVTNRHS
jgi:hypothetical protein